MVEGNPHRPPPPQTHILSFSVLFYKHTAVASDFRVVKHEAHYKEILIFKN